MRLRLLLWLPLLGACHSGVSGGVGMTDSGFIAATELPIRPAGGFQLIDSRNGRHLVSSTRHFRVIGDDGNVIADFPRGQLSSAGGLTPDATAMFVYRGPTSPLYLKRLADGVETSLGENLSVGSVHAGRLLATDYTATPYTYIAIGLDGTGRRNVATGATDALFVSRARILWAAGDKLLLDDASATGTPSAILDVADEEAVSIQGQQFPDIVSVATGTIVAIVDARGPNQPDVATVPRPTSLWSTFALADTVGVVATDDTLEHLIVRRAGQADVTVHTASGFIDEIRTVAGGDILLWSEVPLEGPHRTYLARVAAAELSPVLIGEEANLHNVTVEIAREASVGVVQRYENGSTAVYSVDLAAQTLKRISEQSFSQIARHRDTVYLSNTFGESVASAGIYAAPLDASREAVQVAPDEQSCWFNTTAVQDDGVLVGTCVKGVIFLRDGEQAKRVTPLELATQDASYYGLRPVTDDWVAYRGALADRPSWTLTTTIAHNDGTLIDLQEVMSAPRINFDFWNVGRSSGELLFGGQALIGGLDLTTRASRTILDGGGINYYPLPMTSSQTRLIVTRQPNDGANGVYWLDMTTLELTTISEKVGMQAGYATLSGDRGAALASVYDELTSSWTTTLYPPDGGAPVAFKPGDGLLPVSSITELRIASGATRYLAITTLGAYLLDETFATLVTLPTSLPDGSRFTFNAFPKVHQQGGRVYLDSRSEEHYTPQVMSIDESGGDPRLLADNAALMFFHESFAWYRQRNEASGSESIVATDLNSGSTTVITNATLYSTASRDYGNVHLFRYNEAGTSTLAYVDATLGPVAVRVSDPDEYVIASSYANGRVLYGSVKGDDWATYNVYLVDIATRAKRPVFATPPAFTIGQFTFSTDGKSMVYTASNADGTTSATLVLPL